MCKGSTATTTLTETKDFSYVIRHKYHRRYALLKLSLTKLYCVSLRLIS